MGECIPECFTQSFGELIPQCFPECLGEPYSQCIPQCFTQFMGELLGEFITQFMGEFMGELIPQCFTQCFGECMGELLPHVSGFVRICSWDLGLEVRILFGISSFELGYLPLRPLGFVRALDFGFRYFASRVVLPSALKSGSGEMESLLLCPPRILLLKTRVTSPGFP